MMHDKTRMIIAMTLLWGLPAVNLEPRETAQAVPLPVLGTASHLCELLPRRRTRGPGGVFSRAGAFSTGISRTLAYAGTAFVTANPKTQVAQTMKLKPADG